MDCNKGFQDLNTHKQIYTHYPDSRISHYTKDTSNIGQRKEQGCSVHLTHTGIHQVG